VPSRWALICDGGIGDIFIENTVLADALYDHVMKLHLRA